MSRWFIKLFFVVAIGVILSACGHMPLNTMIKLRNFNPATTDIEMLSVAVDLPEEFQVGIDGVKLTIEMKHKNGTDRRHEVFILSPSPKAEDLAEVAQLQRAGRYISAFRIQEKDYARMDEIRTLALPENGQKLWSGSIGIGTKICRNSTEITEKVLVTTYLKTDMTEGYLPFLVDVDIFAQAQFTDIDSWVPRCQATRRAD